MPAEPHGTDPYGKKNKMENSTGKSSYNPPSGDQHPPAAGAHKPKDVTNHGGGYGAGAQFVHPSLKKK